MSEDLQLRKYLLGELAESEARQAEDRLFAEPDYFELAQSVETDLMDEYRADALPAAERAAWERYLAAHPDSRGRLEFSRAFHRKSAAPQRWLFPALALAAAVLIGFFAISLRQPPIAAPAEVIVDAAFAPGTLRSATDLPQILRLPPGATVARIDWREPRAVKANIRFIDTGAAIWTGPVVNGRSDVPAGILRRGDHVATTFNAAGQETADTSFRIERE